MKRRTFTFGMAAFGLAPALPAMPAASPTALSFFKHAKLIVRAHNRCSPAMLQRLLKVDAAMAAEIEGMLFRKGVISAAGADGAAMAIHPINTNCIPTQALRPSNLAQNAEKVLKDSVESLLEADDDGPADKQVIAAEPVEK